MIAFIILILAVLLLFAAPELFAIILLQAVQWGFIALIFWLVYKMVVH